MTPKNNNSKEGFCSKINKSCILTFGVVVTFALFLNLVIYTNINRSPVAISNIFNQTLQLPHKMVRKIMKEITESKKSKDAETGQDDVNVDVVRPCNDTFRNRHLMTISYSGRTGNLIFQFATLIVTARLTCYTPVRKPDFIRDFDGIFELNVKTVQLNGGMLKTLPEPGYGIYDKNITSSIIPEYNWTLGGFRQSYRYFANYSNLVRSSFVFKVDILKRVSTYLEQGALNNTVKVGIHVRRSDFVRANKPHIQSVSSIEYFQRAIAYVEDRLGRGNFAFLVVSDDHNWCKNNIKATNVHYSPFTTAGDDLYLLTQCDHHILSYGTFGWMGAWLNGSGIVVYDQTVCSFPNGTRDVPCIQSDYYPRHWIGL